MPKVLLFAMFGAWLGSRLHQWTDDSWAISALGLYICWLAPFALLEGWCGQKLNSVIQPVHAAKII
jgi:uncharacterized membrane protein YfcA